MEIWGVKVDTKALKDLSDGFGADLRRLEKTDLRGWPGTEFNINSPQQLAEILFTKLNLPASKKTKVNKRILDVDRHPPGTGAAPSPGQGASWNTGRRPS